MIRSCKKPPVYFPAVTGAICSFNSQYADLPLKSCVSQISGYQEGSGTPSPQNIRSINGYSNINISATGVNLWGGNAVIGGVKHSIPTATEGTDYIEFASNATAKGYFTESVRFKENTQYTFIFSIQDPSATRSNLRIEYTDESYTNVANVSDNNKQTLIVVTEENKTIKGLLKRNVGGETRLFYDECCLLEGVHTVDDFEPFGTYITINLGGTYYFGYYDARTGVFVATDKATLARDVSGWAKSGNVFYRNFSDVWTAVTPDMPTGRKPLLCSHFDYSNNSIIADLKIGYGGANNNGNIVIRYDALSTISDFNDYIANNDVFIVYPLATPQTIQLPTANIETLLGENNIWADTGNTSLKYIKAGR